MFRKVAEEAAIARNRHAHAGCHQAVGLGSGVFAHHDVNDLTGLKLLEPFVYRYLLAIGRKDARNADEVVTSDPGVAKSHLEAAQLFAMSAHALGEEQFRGYVHLWPATSRSGRTEESCRNLRLSQFHMRRPRAAMLIGRIIIAMTLRFKGIRPQEIRARHAGATGEERRGWSGRLILTYESGRGLPEVLAFCRSELEPTASTRSRRQQTRQLRPTPWIKTGNARARCRNDEGHAIDATLPYVILMNKLMLLLILILIGETFGQGNGGVGDPHRTGKFSDWGGPSVGGTAGSESRAELGMSVPKIKLHPIR